MREPRTCTARVTFVATVIAASMILTGCGPNLTIDELAELRDECESRGGVFKQWSGWSNEDQRWQCDFSTENGKSH